MHDEYRYRSKYKDKGARLVALPPHPSVCCRDGLWSCSFRPGALDSRKSLCSTNPSGAGVHAKHRLRRQSQTWSWADTWPVARIEAPRLAAPAIALNGASGQALAFGPGHLQNTPKAGETGTAVYAAHRDTHFAFLKDVEKGDLIRIIRDDGKIFTYRATQMTVTRWDEAQNDIHASGSNVVLATRYPFDAVKQGPLRYLVYAELVE